MFLDIQTIIIVVLVAFIVGFVLAVALLTRSRHFG